MSATLFNAPGMFDASRLYVEMVADIMKSMQPKHVESLVLGCSSDSPLEKVCVWKTHPRKVGPWHGTGKNRGPKPSAVAPRCREWCWHVLVRPLRAKYLQRLYYTERMKFSAYAERLAVYIILEYMNTEILHLAHVMILSLLLGPTLGYLGLLLGTLS